MTDLEPGDSFSIGDVAISTAETAHAPVHPTIGYRLEHEGTVAAIVGDTLPCDGVDLLARVEYMAARGVDVTVEDDRDRRTR